MTPFDGTSNSGDASLLLPEPPSEFVMEKSLAEELQRLSFQERAEIEEEVHGVRCGAAEETPELIESSLLEFDALLHTRKENEEPSNPLLRNVVLVSALDEGQAEAAKAKCYLNDPNVRLRFLRCEAFNVQDAVQRFINFVNFTGKTFGGYVADRPIRLSDFNSEETKILQQSRVQLLPFRDRSGRRVCVVIGSCNFDISIALRFKILIYLNWVASEDLETQRKGFVTIMYVFDEDERPEVSWERHLRRKIEPDIGEWDEEFNDARPVRLVGSHQYYPQKTLFFRLLANLYVFVIRPKERKTYRSFFGDHMELLYKLNSFGVSSDLIPVSSTFKVKTGNQKAWVNVQREIERGNGKDKNGEEIVECPRSQDVVFIPGPYYRKNPGNLSFRALVEGIADEHQAANKEEKYQITVRIVQQIESSGGRFLVQSKSGKMFVVNKDRAKIRAKVASTIKQYNRQRANSQRLNTQLKTVVQTADDILLRSTSPESSSRHRSFSKTIVGAFPGGHQSFGDYQKFSKRPRLQGCFGGVDPDKFCFGMAFNPI